MFIITLLTTKENCKMKKLTKSNWLITLSSLVIYILLPVITQTIAKLLHLPKSGQISFLAAGLMLSIVIIGWIFFKYKSAWRLTKNKQYPFNLKHPGAPLVIGLYFLAFYLMIIVYAQIHMLIQFIGTHPNYASHISNYLIALLIAVFAGVNEEVIFRGFMLKSWLNTCHKVKYPLWLSGSLTALSFGVIHLINLLHQPLGNTLTQVLAASLLGLLYVIIRIISNNLVISICLHTLQDFTAIFINFLQLNNMINANLADASIGIAIIFFLLSLILLGLDHRTKKNVLLINEKSA